MGTTWVPSPTGKSPLAASQLLGSALRFTVNQNHKAATGTVERMISVCSWIVPAAWITEKKVHLELAQKVNVFPFLNLNVLNCVIISAFLTKF